MIATLILLFSSIALGRETDDFTRRYEPIADSNPTLSRDMNERIKTAADLANLSAQSSDARPDAPCSRDRLFAELKDQLFTPVYGSPVEFFAEESAEVPRLELIDGKSIYDPKPDSPHKWQAWFFNPGIYILRASALIRIGKNLLGIDKFGHFLSMGWRYYVRGVDRKTGNLLPQGLSTVIDYGKRTERLKYGAAITGVFSYADLATNLEGFRFWLSIIDGPAPYLRCEKGQWVFNRAFDWNEYVSPAWDEAINCSDFSTPALADVVKENIAALEKQTGRTYTCPVSPKACADLVKHYGSLAKDVLSPECRVHSESGPHLRH